MKYVIIKETFDFESTNTEIIKVVSSKERANEIVSQLNKEIELDKQIKKEKYILIEKLNHRYRNEIVPNQYCFSNYRKESTYKITKELATKTLGYTKEMWKKYVEEQNKIIEENKKNEEDWRLKSIEEQKRIDKEREVINPILRKIQFFTNFPFVISSICDFVCEKEGEQTYIFYHYSFQRVRYK
jgi:hypothetical protein